MRERRDWARSAAARLRDKGAAENALAEPDPLKRLAPAGNGIVFQRALSGIVPGKTVSLMLLPTAQMVSEPRSRAFVRGARSGGRGGLWLSFHGYLLAAPGTGTSAGSLHPGTELNFHPVIAAATRHSSCAMCPCVTMGKPAPRGRAVLVCSVGSR